MIAAMQVSVLVLLVVAPLALAFSSLPPMPEPHGEKVWLIAAAGVCTHQEYDAYVEPVAAADGGTYIASLSFRFFPMEGVQFTDAPYHEAFNIPGIGEKASSLADPAWDHKNIAIVEPTMGKQRLGSNEKERVQWGISVFQVDKHDLCEVPACIQYEGTISAQTENFPHQKNAGEFPCALFVDSTNNDGFAVDANSLTINNVKYFRKGASSASLGRWGSWDGDQSKPVEFKADPPECLRNGASQKRFEVKTIMDSLSLEVSSDGSWTIGGKAAGNGGLIQSQTSVGGTTETYGKYVLTGLEISTLGNFKDWYNGRNGIDSMSCGLPTDDQKKKDARERAYAWILGESIHFSMAVWVLTEPSTATKSKCTTADSSMQLLQADDSGFELGFNTSSCEDTTVSVSAGTIMAFMPAKLVVEGYGPPSLGKDAYKPLKGKPGDIMNGKATNKCKNTYTMGADRVPIPGDISCGCVFDTRAGDNCLLDDDGKAITETDLGKSKCVDIPMDKGRCFGKDLDAIQLTSCLPADALLTVKKIDGSVIISPVAKVSVGDEVLTSRGFSAVYLFSHLAPHAHTKMVRIETEGALAVELSPLHYLEADGQYIFAKDVVVGQRLAGRHTGGRRALLVTKVTIVLKRGLYSPFTLHGDLLVATRANASAGVVVSDQSEWFAEGYLPEAYIPTLYHALLAPARAIYTISPAWLTRFHEVTMVNQPASLDSLGTSAILTAAVSTAPAWVATLLLTALALVALPFAHGAKLRRRLM